MLALPGAGSYQHYRDGGVSQVFVADLLSNCLRLDIAVVNTVNFHRSVDDVLAHLTDEFLHPLSIFVVIANEDPVSWRILFRQDSSHPPTVHDGKITNQASTIVMVSRA